MTGRCDRCKLKDSDKLKEPCISCVNNPQHGQIKYEKDCNDVPSTSIYGFLIPGWSRRNDVEAGKMMDMTLKMFTPTLMLLIMTCLIMLLACKTWQKGANITAAIMVIALVKFDVWAWRKFKNMMERL